jgi:hypothetical protein
MTPVLRAIAFVNAVIAMAKPVESHFLWRTQRTSELLPRGAAGGTGKIEIFSTDQGSQFALTPFVVSSNELRYSKVADDTFFLYRLFRYSSRPFVFMLRGDLEENLALVPTDYRARLRALT